MVRKAEIRKVQVRDLPSSVHDMTAARILSALEDLRVMAKTSGHEAMASSLNRAFDACLSTYVAQKEAQLAERIRAAKQG